MALVGFGMTLQLKGLAASVTDYDRFMQDFVVFSVWAFVPFGLM